MLQKTSKLHPETQQIKPTFKFGMAGDISIISWSEVSQATGFYQSVVDSQKQLQVLVLGPVKADQ